MLAVASGKFLDNTKRMKVFFSSWMVTSSAVRCWKVVVFLRAGAGASFVFIPLT